MKKKRQSQFAKNFQREKYSASQSIQQSKTVLPLPKLYQSCSEVMLDVFIDCLFDENYSLLIKSGNPAKEDVTEAWRKIFTEYCELMNDKNFNELLEVIKDLNILMAKISFINTACDHLVMMYDADIIKALNNFGLKSNLNENDNLDIRADKINMVLIKAKKFVVQLQQKQKEYDKIKADTKYATREYFQDLLLIVSKEYKYAVQPSQITAYQFCKSIMQINEKYNKIEMKNKLKVA